MSVLFARVPANLDSILSLNAQIAESDSSTTRQPFVQYVLRAIHQSTILKSCSDDSMPGMFDIIANFYNSSAIQVQIDGSTDDLATVGIRSQSSPQLKSDFLYILIARASEFFIPFITPMGMWEWRHISRN